MSNILDCIKDYVNTTGKSVFSPFDVHTCTQKTTAFLSKHALDPIIPKKVVYGKAYFIRVSYGLYKINPDI